MVVVVVDKPGKTGIPEVKETQRNQVELTWTAPKDDGGSPITNYVVEYCEETAFHWLRAGDAAAVQPSNRYVVRGLTENTAYKFRVAAQNQAGLGPFTECVVPVKASEPVGLYHRLIKYSI